MQRSLALLKRLGYAACVVERFNHFVKVRQDAMGFIDILAAGNGSILAIQSTTTSNQASRVAKIKAEPRALAWLNNGGRIFVHGWSKKGAKGKRKLWSVTETE